MIVLDASAAVDWILQTPAGKRIEDRLYAHKESLHAPHVLDLEVTQVLRRLARQRIISERRAAEAVRDLMDLRVHRYPHFVLLSRIWQLRDNLSAFDACYIVLAEQLKVPLITRDGRLASASGPGVEVEVY